MANFLCDRIYGTGVSDCGKDLNESASALRQQDAAVYKESPNHTGREQLVEMVAAW